MANSKIIAIIAASAVIVCAVSAAVILSSDSNSEKKGLYQLNAKVSNVNMGQCSATPGVIITIEQLYSDHYGKLVNDDLTIDDARADTEFWNQYCAWTPTITERGNGTFDVAITTAVNSKETVNIPVCDTTVAIGTMYSETIYFLICADSDVKPYTEESLTDQNVKDYLNYTITGGMQYSYYSQEDVAYMLRCVSQSGYYDLGVNSVQSVDPERLTLALLDSNDKGSKGAVYFGSGTRVNTLDIYSNNARPCIETGSYYAFFSPSAIPEVYSCIDCIGRIMGFGQETIDKVIEDIQLRLYKVYYSVQELTAGKTQPKAYWESNSGTAISAAMGKVICGFLGFDISLLDGAEHDLESLLRDKPPVIIFYTNDSRPDDVKMRTNT